MLLISVSKWDKLPKFLINSCLSSHQYLSSSQKIHLHIIKPMHLQSASSHLLNLLKKEKKQNKRRRVEERKMKFQLVSFLGRICLRLKLQFKIILKEFKIKLLLKFSLSMTFREGRSEKRAIQ